MSFAMADWSGTRLGGGAAAEPQPETDAERGDEVNEELFTEMESSQSHSTVREHQAIFKVPNSIKRKKPELQSRGIKSKAPSNGKTRVFLCESSLGPHSHI